MSITVDPAFQAMIPPLADEERQQLEANLLADGCREPLVVWKGHGILLDGHNRYEICTRLGIAFGTVELEFDGRDEAEDWIDANQLGRRNLKPDQASMLRGRRYNRTKKVGFKGNQHTQSGSDHFDPKQKTTASRLAKQHGVNESTIRRDGQFANAVEKAKSADPDVEKKVASGTAPAKAAIIKAAKLLSVDSTLALPVLRGELTLTDAIVLERLPSDERHQAMEAVLSGQAKDAKAAVKAHRKAAAVEACKAARLPDGKFAVIVADPPWQYDARADDASHRAANPYPMMGLGDWLRGQTEHCLMCVRGRPVVTLTNQTTLLRGPLREHSRKPEEFYTLVESLCPGNPRCELFSRAERPGWTSFGAETGKFRDAA